MGRGRRLGLRSEGSRRYLGMGVLLLGAWLVVLYCGVQYPGTDFFGSDTPIYQPAAMVSLTPKAAKNVSNTQYVDAITY